MATRKVGKAGVGPAPQPNPPVAGGGTDTPYTQSGSATRYGNPVPRPNEAAEPVVPEVDPGGPGAGEFRGATHRDHGAAAAGVSHTVGAEFQPPPHELRSHENTRRLYRTDSLDGEDGGDIVTVPG